MANRIQLRRGGAQEWANSNPTLAQGELGIELDTGRFKIGDGVSAWNTLRYERPVESVSNTANTLVQRDADGNFSAGTITATLIGNASTAARLASSRQITLGDDLTGSAIFDGSTNITINASLDLISPCHITMVLQVQQEPIQRSLLMQRVELVMLKLLLHLQHII